MKLISVLSTLVLLFSLSISTQAEAAKNCKKGQPCGNACISKEDVCHLTESGQAHSATPVEAPKMKESAKGESKEAAATTSAAATPAAAPTETTATKVKVCRKGKACGNACIPAKAICHAQ